MTWLGYIFGAAIGSYLSWFVIIPMFEPEKIDECITHKISPLLQKITIGGEEVCAYRDINISCRLYDAEKDKITKECENKLSAGK